MPLLQDTKELEDDPHAVDAVHAVGLQPPLFALRPRVLQVVRADGHAPRHRPENVLCLLGRTHRATDYQRGRLFYGMNFLCLFSGLGVDSRRCLWYRWWRFPLVEGFRTRCPNLGNRYRRMLAGSKRGRYK